MLLNFYVCLCNLGYGNAAVGISPTTFSVDELAEAQAFALSHRAAGMQYPVLIGDLLNRFAFEGRTNELRAMFAALNPNYTDNRLLDLRDYIREDWAM
jgi:hypothetical protein